MLGELEVLLDGKPVPLPASRKTRALLAYLAITKREHQRSRLCEIFWDVPDDPRAALRWSLNKLRPLTNAGRIRLAADREHVSLELLDELDLDRVEKLLSLGVDRAPIEALTEAADAFRGELLEGLDLPNCPLYWEWCKGERESSRRLYEQILLELIARTANDPEECLRHARRRVALDPYSEEAHVAVIRLLDRLGRSREALAQVEDCRRILEQELRVSPSLELLRREIGASPAPPRAPAMRTRERDPIVGRKSEKSRIEQLLSERRPAVLLIEGEPGIGKTRMLGDLIEGVVEAGGRTLASRAFEAEMVRPYGVWIDALRADEQLLRLAPELSASPPATIISQTQVFEAVRGAIASMTSEVVSAVVVDDLQWIDEPSVALLHYVIRALDRSPIVFALGARRAELDDNPSAQRLLRALRSESRLEVIELGPLEDVEISALVRSISERRDVDDVVAASRGNPLVAIELASRPLDMAELTSSRLEHLMLERLDRLAAPARNVALWAAALGRPFTPQLLSKAIGISAGETISAVAELERSAIIRPSNVVPFEYDFAHDLLRRCAYRQLTPPRRRLVHYHLAHALDTELASEIAHHAALGGDDSLAARSYASAGDRSLRLFARGEAARFAHRGIEHLHALPNDQQVALNLALLRVIALSGVEMKRQEELDEELSRLAADAKTRGQSKEAAEALWLKGLLNHDRGNFDIAGTMALEVVATASNTKDPVERARALANAGRCLAQIERDMERAWALLDEAAAIAESAQVTVEEIDWGMGIVRHHLGDHDDATARLERALEHAHRRQDHWAECECLSRMAMIELERHRHDRTLERCRELSIVATKMGEGGEGVAAKALDALAHLFARHAGAEEQLAETISLLRIVDAKGMLAYVLTTAALVDLEQNRARSARERAEEALRAAEIARRPSLIGIAHATLARAALLDESDREARAHLEQAQRIAASPLGVSAHARQVLASVEQAFHSKNKEKSCPT